MTLIEQTNMWTIIVWIIAVACIPIMKKLEGAGAAIAYGIYVFIICVVLTVILYMHSHL